MVKWAYLSVKLPMIKTGTGLFASSEPDYDYLNFYGADGWELVTIHTTSVYEGTTSNVIATFKRKIENV